MLLQSAVKRGWQHGRSPEAQVVVAPGAAGIGLALALGYMCRKPILQLIIRNVQAGVRALRLATKLAAVGSVVGLGFQLHRKPHSPLAGATLSGLFALWLWARTCRPIFRTPDMKKGWRRLAHDKFNASKVLKDPDVIVVGSGMGGLTCAAVLSCCGRKALVLDQHPDRCGGGAHMFDLKGYEFDSGFHYGPQLQQFITWFATNSTVLPPVTFDPLENRHDGVFDYVEVKDYHDGGKGGDVSIGFRGAEAHQKDFWALASDPAEAAILREYLHDSTLGIILFSFWMPMRLLPWRSLPSRFLRWLLRQLGWEQLAGQTVEQGFQRLGITNPRMQAVLNGNWQNCGAPPWECSYVFASGVQRGFPLVFPSYPKGGSQDLARWMCHTVEQRGGQILRDARVSCIIVEDGKVRGVEVNNCIINCSCVVSACGYMRTMHDLLGPAVTARLEVPWDMDELGLKQSPGFVMVNVGVCASAAECGLDDGPHAAGHYGNANLWYHPIREQGDFFTSVREHMEDPLRYEDFPALITFPSEKDRGYHDKSPNKVSVQILVLANFTIFANWADEPTTKRGPEYEEMKKQLQGRALRILYTYYPKIEGKVEYVDVSTPLSAAHYLGTRLGSCIGLGPHPLRMVDERVGAALDSTPFGGFIDGLWLTGQDQFLGGIPMSQLSGLATALRMVGARAALSFGMHCFRMSLRALLPGTGAST